MQNTSFRFTLGGALLGLSLAAGLIISSAQITRVWLHIADSQVITVTGAALQDITSDTAIWSADFGTEADTLAEAQRKLKGYNEKVTAFFKERGITNAEISAISIQRLKPQSNQLIGDDANTKKTIAFHLLQYVRVTSTNIQQVINLQQQSVALVEQGVEFDDQGVQFIYSKTAEAKIEMLAAATRDARQRAEQIAGQGGRKIRALKSAKMGVFQITGRNSNETSAEGINDTSAKDKRIRAVVSANFMMQ